LDAALIQEAFEIAMRSGGNKELDFERTPGQSYNPRPARVALILLDSETRPTGELLGACFIASVESCSGLPQGGKWNEVIGTAKNAQRLLKAPASVSDPSLDTILLASALHLDRARQFHRSKNSKNPVQHHEFCELTEKIIELISDKNDRLSLLLTAWLKRFKNKHRTK
jgi:hypothetical protein